MNLVSVFLAFVAFALLLHLAIFHFYINYVGITTYEYVRAHRMALEPQAFNQSNLSDAAAAVGLPQQNKDQTVNRSCCQIFKKKAKVVPVNTSPQAQVNNADRDGKLEPRRSTVEKLPPIFPSPKKVKSNDKIVENSTKPKGSSVPKLPKLVEENGNNLNTLDSVNSNGSSTIVNGSKRPHLAKLHKHLESVDYEDQDKIFVVEVS